MAVKGPCANMRTWHLARVWLSVVLIVSCLMLVWWGTHRMYGAPADTDTKFVGTTETTATIRAAAAKSSSDAKTPQISQAQIPPATASPITTANLSEPDVSTPSPSMGVSGCSVCRDPVKRATFAGSLNATTRLQCQAFWHLRFPGEKDTIAMWYVVRSFISIIISSCVHLFLFALLWSFLRFVRAHHSILTSCSCTQHRPLCLEAAIEERAAARAKFCELCKEVEDEAAAVASKVVPGTKGGPRAGVVFSIGTHHLGLVAPGVSNLRKNVGYTGVVEVYCDDDKCVTTCNQLLSKLDVACVRLKAEFTVR